MYQIKKQTDRERTVGLPTIGATMYAGREMQTPSGSRTMATSLAGLTGAAIMTLTPLASWETESIPSAYGNGKVIAYFVHPSTDSVDMPTLEDATQTYAPESDPATPFREHAAIASHALGLGKSQIARILGVSRVTLYDWLNGKREPKEGDNPERLRILGALAAEVSTTTQRPIYHRFVEQSLPGHTMSVLDLLLQPEWDVPRIRALLWEARRLTTERDQRILANSPTAKISESERHGIFIDNMIALGLE